MAQGNLHSVLSFAEKIIDSYNGYIKRSRVMRLRFLVNNHHPCPM